MTAEIGGWTLRPEQLRRLARACRENVVDEIVNRMARRAKRGEAPPRDAQKRLARQALRQAQRFGFVSPEAQAGFAEHCLARGELFAHHLESHLLAADVAHPERPDFERLRVLIDLQQRGLGTRPYRRPERDPVSQPFRLSDGTEG